MSGGGEGAPDGENDGASHREDDGASDRGNEGASDREDDGTTESDGSPSVDPADLPLDGTVVQYAAALASVGPAAYPALLATVQEHLDADRARYEREFECVHRDEARAVFLVPSDHWETVGEALSLSAREAKAVRRAHERQLTRLGRRTDRGEEFESALDIRSAVVVGF